MVCMPSDVVQARFSPSLPATPLPHNKHCVHMDLSTTMRHYITTKRTAQTEGIHMLDERLSLNK